MSVDDNGDGLNV